MSSLDQAFIRAYTKDRRTQNQAAPSSNSAAGSPGAAATTRNVGSGDSQSNSGGENLHTSQSGNWFRVDPATSSSTNHHRRMGNELPHEPQAPYRESSTKLPLTNDKFSVVHPAQYPTSHLNANIHPGNTTNSHRGSNIAQADSNDAQAFVQLHPASNSPAPSVDNLIVREQRAGHKTAIGRQTLANYLAQSQAAIAPASLPTDPTATIKAAQWTATTTDTNTIPIARSSDSQFAAWRYDTLSNEPSHNLEAHLNKKVTSIPPNKFKSEEHSFKNSAAIPNPVSNVKEIASQAEAPQQEMSDTQKIKEAILDFNSVWEVDELYWPEVSDELFKQQERSFNKVAAYLSDACRGGLSVLAVTSAGRGEGRTTVASCVARCAAKRGLKVVLVDGDLEHPSLADSLNLEIARGWSDALQENIPLEEVAVHSIEDQLTLIPLVTTAPSQDFSSTDSRIQSMLQRLTESFDLVVLDVPQVNSVGSRMIGAGTSPGIDAALLVTDCRMEDSQRIDTALRRLKNLGIHSVGVVENFARS
jgi:Mrp family chromosome partitioning ATPase